MKRRDVIRHHDGVGHDRPISACAFRPLQRPFPRLCGAISLGVYAGEEGTRPKQAVLTAFSNSGFSLLLGLDSLQAIVNAAFGVPDFLVPNVLDHER